MIPSLIELSESCPDISVTIKLSDLLGVDASTLWRWDKMGYLKAVRQG